MQIRARQVLLLHSCRQVLAEASARGIDMAPLKGAHLLTSVYPASAPPRPMVDVDVLVRPRDWERALEMMRDLACRPATLGSRKAMHEAGFLFEVAPGVDVMVEVHRYLFEPRRIPIDHEGLWERTLPSTFESVPCRRLAVEDHVVHASLHAAIHRLMQLARAVADVVAMLRHGDPESARIVARARQWRATRATWLLLDLVHEAHPSLGAGRMATELAPSWATMAALRALVPGPEATRVRGLHHRLQAAVLWPVLLDGPAVLAQLVRNHPGVRRMVELPRDGRRP